MNYGELSSHRLMVRDEARTAAFQRAIERSVKPGDVVLDLGAGSGILSLFAARAGAARIYAVERDPRTAAFAAELIRRNGFDSVVRVLPGDIRAVRIPERVNLIVSEWMGTIGIDENMYGALLWARDNLLADGGQIIPRSVTTMIAPAAPAQRPDSAFFMERPYGLDLSPLCEPSVNELLMVRRRVTGPDLAAAPQKLWTQDAASDSPDLVRNPITADLVFEFEKKAAASALAAWFVAELADDVILSNAPNAPDTHWGQMLLPLATRLEFQPGDRLAVSVTAWPVGPGPLMFAWKWQVNDGPPAQLDTAGGTGAPQMEVAAAEASATVPQRRSALSRYLAELALDPDKLAELLADPDAALASLSEEHAEALRSRDPYRIGMAMFEAEDAK